jgi:hypothetical protein
MLGPGVGSLLARMITKRPADGDAEILAELDPYRAFGGDEALK